MTFPRDTAPAEILREPSSASASNQGHLHCRKARRASWIEGLITSVYGTDVALDRDWRKDP